MVAANEADPVQGRGAPGRVLPALIVVVALAMTGCADRGPGSAVTPPDEQTTGEPPLEDPAEIPADLPTARVEGDAVLLDVAGAVVEVARFEEQDGEPVHASVRPGGHERTVVLALARVDDGDVRYELRYLTITGDLQADLSALETTDLYWFPFRQQVDEQAGSVLDVAPVPVWAPDGSALAWIEWTSEGTRLRTVTWFDDGVSSNPSHETYAYRLVDVPAGTQLEEWHGTGSPVLIARGEDEQRYRIEVELGAPA